MSLLVFNILFSNNYINIKCILSIIIFLYILIASLHLPALYPFGFFLFFILFFFFIFYSYYSCPPKIFLIYDVLTARRIKLKI